jgi:hypothetical protein
MSENQAKFKQRKTKDTSQLSISETDLLFPNTLSVSHRERGEGCFIDWSLGV